MVDEQIIELLLIEDSKGDAELTLRSLKRMNLENNIKVLCRWRGLLLNFIYSKGKYADRVPPPRIYQDQIADVWPT